jgi:hypothetical protein
MGSLQVATATVLVLNVTQLGAQVLCYLGLLARRTAYKTMCLCWTTCALTCIIVQLWPGVALAAPFAVVTGLLWWRHHDDDDDVPKRRRHRARSAIRSKIPRPVAVARPTPSAAPLSGARPLARVPGTPAGGASSSPRYEETRYRTRRTVLCHHVPHWNVRPLLR